ncbi:MAG: metallophosphoesterase [Planctomycetota bacterium]|nr:MAG: metallophosphoesterase [Planctomycetota bacterium]
MKEKLSRREFISGTSAAAIGVVTGLPAIASAMAGERPSGKRKRVLRIAHFTDIHVQPEGAAPQGMARALRSAQSLADKPDIIFTGGDSIMDSLKANKARTKAQWAVFQSVLKNECSLPVVHCIGNHDVWGWGLEDESVKSDKLYGKQWAVEELELESRYYRFDKAGWRFIVLDSTHVVDKVSTSSEPYTAKLDEEQFEWLKKVLEETVKERPICVLSHIPIICFCAFFDGENEKSGDWVVPGAWMHIDGRRIKDLFYAHKNVRLCLSGHMHMQDKVKFLGVKYLCDGAVCGSWWEGNHYEFPPGYVVVDLYNDGSSKSEYITYKWQ